MSAAHPEMQAILEEQRRSPLIPAESMTIPAARAQFDAAQLAWNADLPPMHAEDLVVGGVACRHLVPEGAPAALVVFVHGGGWTFGGLDSHARFARLLARDAAVRVLIPDYRLAPEHAAPAAIDDLLAVLADLGGLAPARLAPAQLALCGDSAGANIALAAALDRPPQRIDFLSLLYGCFAPAFDTPSHAANGDGAYGLSTARMRWYWNNWLGTASDPRAIPLHRDLRGLPPTHLLAAGLDPILDDTLMMAAEMARASVPVRMDVIPGVTHGFLQMTSRLAPARDATTIIAAALDAALNQ